MGAKHFTELRAWQSANRLKIAVWEFTERAPARNDRKFCDQIRSSSSSAPDNIAEGFGRYDHKEFAQFLKVARGSLSETQSQLIAARDRGYLARPEFQELWEIAAGATASVVSLHRYVATHPTPNPWDLKRAQRT